MRILFRTDASPQIGSGHVMRCLALAQVLVARGATVVFLCRREGLGALAERITESGIQLVGLSPGVSSGLPVVSSGTAHESWLPGGWQQDVQACLAALNEYAQADWLIVDHYALDRAWENAMRDKVRHVMVIDDLADREHDCELLLDQNLFPDSTARYAGKVSNRCRILLGPRHALLRPRFRILRNDSADRSQSVSRVLVFFGAADPADVTAVVLRALDAFPSVSVDVVIGPDHPGEAAHEAWCARRTGAVLHHFSDRFHDLMAAADLMIGAGGATTWERCCLGLPCVVIGIADNQYAVARHAGEAGVHLYLGTADQVRVEDVAGAIRCLIISPALRVALSRAGKALVDGLGVRRVADAILPCCRVSVRLAGADDGEMLYRWRNDPATRQYFIDPSPIALEHHLEWFSRALSDPDRVLLVGEDEHGTLGAIRYDLRGDEAEISVYLAPERRGEGVGASLIVAGSRWLQSGSRNVCRLVARVIPQNHASASAFSDAGFIEFCHQYVLDL